MGILDKFLGKTKKQQAASTLMEDIPKSAAWFERAMISSGYELDGTLESFRELDRFVDEEKRPGGILDGKVGSILFGMGSYMGQTLIARLGGQWETDDEDPEGEVNLVVRLDGGTAWPVQRAIKRFKNGPEDSIYAYGMVLNEMVKKAGR